MDPRHHPGFFKKLNKIRWYAEVGSWDSGKRIEFPYAHSVADVEKAAQKYIEEHKEELQEIGKTECPYIVRILSIQHGQTKVYREDYF